jgi:hypothetical protein
MPFIVSSSKSDVEARIVFANRIPCTPTNVSQPNAENPSKPPQFPSIVEALIAWQQRRVFCNVGVSLCSNSAGLYFALKHVDLNVRHGVCSSSDSLVARLAVPDSDRVSLDGCLSAEGADVFGVLSDFHLLHLFAKGGTVSKFERSASAFWHDLQLCISLSLRPLMNSNVERGREIDFAVHRRNCTRRMGLTTYLVPYLPVTPTFLVLFVILAEVAVDEGS